ncbi:MAG: hypothetical protein AAGC55_26755 [Myxococcota bacterium]
MQRISIVAVAVLLGCGERLAATPGEIDVVAPKNPRVVRVAAVNTTVSTGLLDALLPDFTAASGLDIELLGADEVSEGKRGRGHKLFEAARAGQVDLIIAHYGKPDVVPFVSEGLGELPRLVFANQVALIGPADDPAQIAGMSDAAQALAKIAAVGAPYIVNNLDGLKYLSSVLWHAADQPERGSWYIEAEEGKARAVRLAEERGGYVLFGVQPFLHFKNKHDSDMEILVWRDPLLQRAMATIVVSPERVRGVNHAGALALQRYLLSAPVQAKIRAFRMSGNDQQFWWPMARNNNPTELLPTSDANPGD